MRDPRQEVASTARMLARAGLVGGFGHVSVRNGDGIAISSTRPLVVMVDDDVLVLDGDGRVVDGPAADVPIEAPMHRAIYAARPDVGAIARGHPPNVVIWGTGTRELTLLHGLGALAGRRVRVHPDIDLIASPEAARSVAATLESDMALCLRANGALAVGSSAAEAATRLYFLEDRARVALGVQTHDPPIPGSGWEDRLRHVEAELRRAVRWFEHRFGDEHDPATMSSGADRIHAGSEEGRPA